MAKCIDCGKEILDGSNICLDCYERDADAELAAAIGDGDAEAEAIAAAERAGDNKR